MLKRPEANPNSEIPSSFGFVSDFGLRISNFSSSSPSAAPRLKKSLQSLRKIFSRAEAQRIDARAPQGAIQFSQALGIRRREFVAHRAAAGVQFNQFSGFGVLHCKQSRRGQHAFARVMKMEAH